MVSSNTHAYALFRTRATPENLAADGAITDAHGKSSDGVVADAGRPAANVSAGNPSAFFSDLQRAGAHAAMT